MLDVLRSTNGTDPIGIAELRSHGIETPAQMVYELQLAGHDIQRTYGPKGSDGRKLLGYRLRSMRGDLGLEAP